VLNFEDVYHLSVLHHSKVDLSIMYSEMPYYEQLLGFCINDSVLQHCEDRFFSNNTIRVYQSFVELKFFVDIEARLIYDHLQYWINPRVVVERGISVSNNQFHMRTLNLDLYRKCAVLFIQENLIDVPIVERDYDNSVESDDADELLFCYNISKSEITTISIENYMKEFINGDSRDEISMVDEPKTRKFLIPDIDDLRFNELDELINVHNEHMSEFVEEKLQKFDFERIDVMINYHGLGDAYGSLVSSVRKSGSIRNFSILSYCEIIWKGRVAFRYHVTRSDVSHFVIVIPVSSHLLGYSVISRFLDEEDDLKFVVSEEENGWSNPCSCFGVSTWFCGDVECPFQDAISCNSRIDYLTRDGRSWILLKQVRTNLFG